MAIGNGLHQVSILLDVSRVSLGQEKDRLEIQEVHDLLSLAKVRDTAGYPLEKLVVSSLICEITAMFTEQY